jgi:hypothetical protein
MSKKTGAIMAIALTIIAQGQNTYDQDRRISTLQSLDEVLA